MAVCRCTQYRDFCIWICRWQKETEPRGLAWALKTSKPTPSSTTQTSSIKVLSTPRPCLLQQSHTLQWNSLWACRDHFYSHNHHTVQAISSLNMESQNFWILHSQLSSVLWASPVHSTCAVLETEDMPSPVLRHMLHPWAIPFNPFKQWS